jgi:hypothetical protein
MTQQKTKKHTILLIAVLLLTVTSTYASVHGEINIRIIQGGAYVYGDYTPTPLGNGTKIKITVSDGNEKITTVQNRLNISGSDDSVYINFGTGFSSIDEGEHVLFSILYNGEYIPAKIIVNASEVEFLDITSADIYTVKLIFYEETIPLPAPSTPDPANNEQQIALNPTLQWVCNISSGLQACYDVFLSTSTPFDINDCIAEDITDTQYTVHNLSYSTTYYWQIQVKDEQNSNELSPIWRFTTKDNPAPDQPSNPVPSNASTDIPKNKQIQWSCSDPDDEQLTYDVYFGTSMNLAKKTSNQTGATYDPGVLSYDTTYYWRVVAWDEADQKTIGPVWQFTVSDSNMGPYVPSNPEPTNGTTDTDLNITLQWQGGDKDSDTISYDLFFGTTNSPSIKQQNLTQALYQMNNLSYDTTYYWKIVSTDDDDAVENGSIWSFTTKSKQSTGLPTAHAGGPYAASVGESITFDASESTDDTGISGYRWDFTSDGTYDTDWSTSPTTTHVYNSVFDGNVKVMVKDTDNNTDVASTTVRILSGNNPPSTPTIEGPVSANANTSITINITSTDTDGDQITYIISWGDNSLATTVSGASGSKQSSSHMYTVPGWYTITVTAKDTSNAERSEEHFIIINQGTANEETEEKTSGFPWIYIIILVIIIAVAGILFYLYQTDKLPVGQKSSKNQSSTTASFKNLFTNTFQRNKNSKQQNTQISQENVNLSRSIPQPVTNRDQREKQSRMPRPLVRSNKGKPSTSLDSQSNTGEHEFKRL